MTQHDKWDTRAFNRFHKLMDQEKADYEKIHPPYKLSVELELLYSYMMSDQREQFEERYEQIINASSLKG